MGNTRCNNGPRDLLVENVCVFSEKLIKIIFYLINFSCNLRRKETSGSNQL